MITNHKFRRPKYLLKRIDEVGAVGATKRLVSSAELSDGFTDLALMNLLDKSLGVSLVSFAGPCSIFSEEVKAPVRRKLGR